MTSLKISDSFQVFIRESTHLHSYQYPRTSRALDSHKHCVKTKAFASLALAKMMLAEHLTVSLKLNPGHYHYQNNQISFPHWRMHKSLDRYKEEKKILFKRKVTRCQRLIRSVKKTHQPIEKHLYLLFVTVIRHLDNCSLPLSSKAVFCEGKMLTLRRSCWVMNK